MPAISIETSKFHETARSDLLALLENVPGKKNLVLQKDLVGPVEALVKFSTLQEYGVDRIFFLENDNVDGSQQNVIFIAGGEKGKQAHSIAAQVKRVQQASSNQHDFTVFWVPRRTLVCEKVFEEAGILGDITSLEWPLWLQPLDTDLLTLGLESSFSELYLDQDPTSIFLSAKALTLLQEQHGLFPRILGKGDNAKRLADLLIRMRSESTADPSRRNKPLLPSTTIDGLIIIGRATDFATPFLTQLTYEGLIDETFHISNSQIEVSTSIIGALPSANTPPTNTTTSGSSSQTPPATTPATPAPLRRRVLLTPSDTLYNTLRATPISLIGPTLNRTARRLQTDFSLGPQNNKTVSELRDFVTKLPGYQAEQQSLKTHTSLAEHILSQTRSELWTKALEVQQNLIAGTDPSSLNDLIEELIARDLPLSDVLRLLCLASVVNNGLRAKYLDNFKRLVVQAYGYQHIVTLSALERMGLLVPSSSRSISGVTSTIGAGVGGLSSYIPGLGSNTSATNANTNRHNSPAPPARTTSSAAEPPKANAAPEATLYNSLRKPLHLIIDDIDDSDPSDIAYAYSGYAPLSIRIIQSILQKQYLAALTANASNTTRTAQSSAAKPAANLVAARIPSNLSADNDGWADGGVVERYVKGATVDIVQAPLESDKAGRVRGSLIGSGGSGVSSGTTGAKAKTTVIFFLGGVTYAEVAAVRLIAKQFAEAGELGGGDGGSGGAKQLVIVTTSMIRGDTVISAAIDASVARRI